MLAIFGRESLDARAYHTNRMSDHNRLLSGSLLTSTTNKNNDTVTSWHLLSAGAIILRRPEAPAPGKMRPLHDKVTAAVAMAACALGAADGFAPHHTAAPPRRPRADCGGG